MLKKPVGKNGNDILESKNIFLASLSLKHLNVYHYQKSQ